MHDVEQQLNKLDVVNVLDLGPTYFMESLLAHVGMTRNMGINGSDIKGDVKVAMIATRATAPVAADRLTKRDCWG